MKRREFITLLGGAAAAWPVVARAQQLAVPTIGFFHVGSADALAHLVTSFRQGLGDRGYTESRNLTIEFRWADGQYDRLPAMVSDLVRRQVSVIVTGGGEATVLAAKAATTTIPIVFNIGGDPVKSGIVASLGRPGGNLTGVNIFASELESKRFGLLHELVPTASAIAYLANPNFPPSAANLVEIEAAAKQLGRRVLLFKATNASEIDAAFSALLQAGAGAVLVGSDPFFYSRRAQIVALTARHSIPAGYEQREIAPDGGLMSYGTNVVDSYRQMGIYAGNILKGTKPADLPVLQLTKFPLVINLKTARTLGLTIPSGVLSIADEVIE